MKRLGILALLLLSISSFNTSFAEEHSNDDNCLAKKDDGRTSIKGQTVLTHNDSEPVVDEIKTIMPK